MLPYPGIHDSSTLMALYNLLLYFVLMILFVMAGRNYAHGFVANVIIESLKKLGIYLQSLEMGDEMLNENDVSVPVIVDDVKDLDRFKMTRCGYFSIESKEPSLGWTITLREREIPFMLLNLSGVIFEPIEGGEFDSIDKIRNLFDGVESEPNLFIDTNDIWVPNFVFQGEAGRGQVYRMGYRFFKAALMFREDKISEKEFMGLSEELREGISFSEMETGAFKEFQELIIKESIEQYPKNKEFALTWKE